MSRFNTIVVEDPITNVIEIITPGAQGPPGYIDGMDQGITTGDFIRWNTVSEVWEVAQEPLEVKQIVLTPAEEAVLNKEGSLWYKSTDKSLNVCTED